MKLMKLIRPRCCFDGKSEHCPYARIRSIGHCSAHDTTNSLLRMSHVLALLCIAMHSLQHICFTLFRPSYGSPLADTQTFCTIPTLSHQPSLENVLQSL